jgi:2'-5' RNA ligase
MPYCGHFGGDAGIELRYRNPHRRKMIYVLAHPSFAPDVAENIDRFRSAHEPERARLVRPHVTLVFGLKNADPVEFTMFCTRVAEGVAEIDIEFVASECSYDPFEKAHKMLLLSAAGSMDVTALHEQLYDGPHRSELHPGIPYRPHMTVATHEDRRVIDGLDVEVIGSFPLRGRINALEIVELSGGALKPVRTIPLGK